MSELTIFNFENNAIRLVTNDGHPWFVAKDICTALDINNSRQAMTCLDDDEKGVITHDTPGGNQRLSIVSEPGLYSLILRSRKPEAKQFKRWITHEVIPMIRKTGGAYLSDAKAEELIRNPDLVISLAQQVKDLRIKSDEQAKQIEGDRPKTIFADSVSASTTSILIRDMAKLLKQNGIDMGQNRLFDWLRGNGYLIKAEGRDYNSPTQRAMELGLFEIKETAINRTNGIRVQKTPMITGKGQAYFINKFFPSNEEATA